MDNPLNMPKQEIPVPEPPMKAPSPKQRTDETIQIRRHDEPLPNPSLPAYPRITPRGFDVEFEPRKFRAGAATAAPEGAFYTMRTVVSEGADNGDIYLQGGQATAGSGTATVAEILLFDASAGAEGTWQGTVGQHLVLTISGTGSEVDDVLMPTFDLTTGTAAVAASVGSNTLPTVGALSGTCKVSLGVFLDAGFSPSLPGNVQASFCFGGFTVSRF